MLLDEILKVVEDHEEMDWESEARFIVYEVSWEDNKVMMNRITNHYSPEYDGGHGVIDTVNYGSKVFEEDCNIIGYANLLTSYIMYNDQYKHEYGDVVDSLSFKKIL